MNLEGRKPVEAKRVGGALVAAFRASKPRLVWRFDLEKNHSFSIAVEGEDGDCELGVTSPRGEFYPVARFASREDAEEALAEVQKALMRTRCSKGWKIAGAAALVLLCLLFLQGYFHRSATVAQMQAPVTTAAPLAAPEPGMPMPADQVLQPPP